MDTRSKIITAEAALALTKPLVVVTGYFDVLRAEHARELEAIRRRNPDGPLLAVVLCFAGEVLDIQARARMVAALRVVDYVVAAPEPDADALLEALHARTIVRMEADDARRNREIAELIRRRLRDQ